VHSRLDLRKRRAAVAAGAIEALVNQARSDADMTNAKCAYADTNPEAALICSLFDSAPPLTDPLVSRKSPGARALEHV
jgi:hypothetical protein